MTELWRYLKELNQHITIKLGFISLCLQIAAVPFLQKSPEECKHAMDELLKVNCKFYVGRTEVSPVIKIIY